ncbi:hypothetical protein D3C80_1583010 [compost metagenome]
MPKDDPDVQVNTQVNIGNMSEFEAARRVAFMLAKAAYQQDIEAQPEEVPRWIPPDDAPDMPEPVADPAREQWASELPLTPSERADNALVRETQTSLATYTGSSLEQAGVQRQESGGRRTVNVIRRDQLRNKLL